MGATGETDSGRESIEDTENEAEAVLLLLNEQKKRKIQDVLCVQKGEKQYISIQRQRDDGPCCQ